MEPLGSVLACKDRGQLLLAADASERAHEQKHLVEYIYIHTYIYRHAYMCFYMCYIYICVYNVVDSTWYVKIGILQTMVSGSQSFP